MDNTRGEVLEQLGRAYGDGLLTADEYNARVAALDTAETGEQVLAQLEGLPYADETPQAPASLARVVLAVGLVSVPLAFCLIGGALGVAAIALGILRVPRPRPKSAIAGMVLGGVAIVVTIAVVMAVVFLRSVHFSEA